MSIKAVPMSLVMQGANGKSYMCNLLDTPGHVNFSDEVTASLRFADAILMVVDAVEGVMVQTERIIKHALQEGCAAHHLHPTWPWPQPRGPCTANLPPLPSAMCT